MGLVEREVGRKGVHELTEEVEKGEKTGSEQSAQ